ncbi:hypothetical protein KEM54_002646 [Ascosphaera aggregata]|nr:hypothetical protein KEM54_002646 [Ascosphaera aggregata]
MLSGQPPMKRLRSDLLGLTSAKRNALLREIDLRGLKKMKTQRPSFPEKSSIDTAIHVIRSEKEALANIETLYTTNIAARSGMQNAVDAITSTIQDGAKLVVSGVGKSGKIGQKITATMNSLGIHASFLHPAEALHGDLGMVRARDSILAISYSGKTQELTQMISHIPKTTTLIAMTQHTSASECPLLNLFNNFDSILLPAPVHMPEEENIGVAAPTTSTTVALAVGDALALAIAEKLHAAEGKRPSDVFRKNHPGGSIGKAAASTGLATPPEEYCPPTSRRQSAEVVTPPRSINSGDEDGIERQQGMSQVFKTMIPDILSTPLSELAVPLSDVTFSYKRTEFGKPRISDIMRVAMRNGGCNSWIMITPRSILSPSRLRGLCEESDLAKHVSESAYADVHESSWIELSPSTTVAEALHHLVIYKGLKDGDNEYSHLRVHLEGQVIALVEQPTRNILGFLEAGDLLQ